MTVLRSFVGAGLAGLVAGLLAAFAPPLHAEPLVVPGPADSLLLVHGSADSMRTDLQRLVAETDDPVEAATALYYRGLSFERASMADSAIACYRASLVRVVTPAGQEAYVDALLRRHAPGDVEEVIRRLSPPRAAAPEPDFALVPDKARLGWAYVVGGKLEQGLALLTPLENRLKPDITWRYRLARAYTEAGDAQHATPYLENLSLLGRGQDPEIAALLKQLDASSGGGAHLADQVKTNIQHTDERETQLLRQKGGIRVRIRASDGTFIGATLYADSTARKSALPVLILADIGDEPASYDSLIVALRGAKYQVMLLDPRGWGWSVAPDCALPDTWRGREDALESRVARDVHDALTAFGRAAPTDTSHALLIGVGGMAPVAVAAARLDRRVAALALIDPLTVPVARGATLAAVRTNPRPTYIQLSLLHRQELPFASELYRLCPLPGSRLAPVNAREQATAAFGGHPDITRKFLLWSDEAMHLKPASRSTPRKTPQAG